MFKSGDENAGRIHNIKTGNKFFEMVEEFKCLITTLKVKIPFR